MNRLLHIAVLAALAASFPLAVSAAISAAEVRRYDVILSRKLFGAAPKIEPKVVKKAPAKPPAPKGPPLDKVFRLASIMHVADDDYVVYLENLKSKSYVMMRVGDTDADANVTLLDADYYGDRVRVGRGSEDVWINMFDGLGRPASPAAGGAEVAQSRGEASGARGDRSVARKARTVRPPVRHREVVSSFTSKEELDEHLQSLQMDVIREQIVPPLPLQLTQENDDALVAEGVLPPAE